MTPAIRSQTGEVTGHAARVISAAWAIGKGVLYLTGEMLIKLGVKGDHLLGATPTLYWFYPSFAEVALGLAFLVGGFTFLTAKESRLITIGQSAVVLAWIGLGMGFFLANPLSDRWWNAAIGIFLAVYATRHS